MSRSEMSRSEMSTGTKPRQEFHRQNDVRSRISLWRRERDLTNLTQMRKLKNPKH